MGFQRERREICSTNGTHFIVLLLNTVLQTFPNLVSAKCAGTCNEWGEILFQEILTMKNLKNMGTEIHSLQKSNDEMRAFRMNQDDEE